MKIVHATITNKKGKSNLWWHFRMIECDKRTLKHLETKKDLEYESTLYYLLLDNTKKVLDIMKNMKFYEDEDKLLGGLFCQE